MASLQPNPLGPYRLLTVNTASDRAQRLVGRIVADLKDQYSIQHIKNIEKIEDVRDACESIKPDWLFCASMWTQEESEDIRNIAMATVPGIKVLALPKV